MGLNYLLHRHQVSLMRADAASSREARRCHRELALGYARRIEETIGAGRDGRMPLVPVS